MDIIELRNEIYCRRDMLIRYFVRKGMRDEAEDMASRTMIKAVENIEGLRDEDKLENWLMRIAANERNGRIREMVREEKRVCSRFARTEWGGNRSGGRSSGRKDSGRSLSRHHG